MIKMGKMKVNENVSTKTFLWLMIFSMLLLILFVGYTISDYVKTKDYIKLDAVIVYVGIEYVHESDSNYSYVEYKYEYEGQTYTNKQRIFFKFNKKTGDIEQIHINPNNPNEVKDSYMTTINPIISCVMFIIMIFMIKAYNIRRKL